MSTVTVALVGCGGMGLRHLKAYAALHAAGNTDVRLTALCDGDEHRREAAVTEYLDLTGETLPSVAAIEDLPALGQQVDAVDIAVPTHLHAPLAALAFDQGHHVLVEKPIALTISDARAMATAAQRAGRVLAVAENFRRVAGNRAVQDFIASGLIGTPYFTTAQLSLPASLLHPQGGGEWYRDRSRSGSLVALEMGVHEMDLLQYWFGPAVTVSASVHTYEPQAVLADGRRVPVTSEDSCFGHVSFAAGVHAQIVLTMAGHGEVIGNRLLVGSTGSLTSTCWENWQGGWLTTDDGSRHRIDDRIRQWVATLPAGTRTRLFPTGTWNPADLTVDVTDPVRYGIAHEIVDFAHAIRTGSPPETGAPEAIQALAGAVALLESSAARAEVAVADVLDGTVAAWQRSLDRIAIPTV
ncbi:Gfo/Idh/MocA family oxidoreductase [Micromonospora sp. HNM0581]|uniref:Gfo/Idh/MocA family protein n=1 Tax=Micromonospora sp. HNM0581 TaxID=2716341 RepID=UPI001469C4D8|nr:Gfo/Idh/MocA family oxidoreductase [Micromonospora sp. HNM0581]NLU78499.1 Gfo/Idh/MocA family oxidoreductase [Micromonospora sp. HNM0581]